MNLVIVESPAKAKSINKYLGNDYKVLASYGHVRDLVSKDGSVRPEDDFSMLWEVDGKAKKRLSEISAALKSSDRLILATDPDREGEAISWHVLEILKQKGGLKNKKIERVVFNAITRQAVLEAMKKPRALDDHLVNAYLARRALDYLVGFTLSPILWRKLPGARSAGRVQSVALRLICQREQEIEAFQSREYWTIEALCRLERDSSSFLARLFMADGQKLDKFALKDQNATETIVETLKGGKLLVETVENKPVKRLPYPPFTTSTLQQEASRKLGFSSKKTMQIAQKLYEGITLDGETTGLITYMRTDGVQIVPEVVHAIRALIEKRFGARYLSESQRIYKTKAKNAQEAHEAIRPTQVDRLPSSLASLLDRDHLSLYELIWQRTVASQMENAQFERMTVDLSGHGKDGKVYKFRAVGSTLLFDGFLSLYQEGKDEAEEEENRRLPLLKVGEASALEEVKGTQHFTEPPPRYSEASLIKKMEEIGIGRPSTYTSILSVLHERGYVRQEQKRLFPEDKGRIVTFFLESFFAKYVEYHFTAYLEEQLDCISSGESNWKDVLKSFWDEFSKKVEDVKGLKISEVLEALNAELAPIIFPKDEEGNLVRVCPACKEGTLSLKLGKFGAFLGCSGYPTCAYTRQMGEQQSDGGDEAKIAASKGTVLGVDPESGEEVAFFSGRFGPYVQLGKGTKKQKPKRCSVPKEISQDRLDLNLALKLLSLPREIGLHPETKEKITVGLGKYGPFVHHQKIYASLEHFEDLFTLGLNHAIVLLEDKKQKGSGGKKRPSKEPLKTFGEVDKTPVLLMVGRYGPYLKWGDFNIKIPKTLDPEHITAEQVHALVMEKKEGGVS